MLLELQGNREQGTGNREQGTGNREQGRVHLSVVRSQESGVSYPLSGKNDARKFDARRNRRSHQRQIRKFGVIDVAEIDAAEKLTRRNWKILTC